MKSGKGDKYLDFARELKNMQHESDGDTNCNSRTRYYHQMIVTGIGGLGNKRKSGNPPNYNIIDIGQNSNECHGDLSWLDVTQIPV